MKILRTSHFKNPLQDRAWFNTWVNQLESNNNRKYERLEVYTALGKTHIWGINTNDTNLEALVIFPGARTTSLFWDLDNGLDNLVHKFRIYLVETNGLPNLSDGDTPDIKSDEYGIWANQLLDKLNISNAYIAGASFGGLIAMKLCIVAPQKVKAAFLLNPGCLQSFSLSPKNLYYNLLPIIAPSQKNVSKFLNKAIFCKPNHRVSKEAEKLIVDYEVFALTRFKDKTQKPYDMDKELKNVSSKVYLIEGDNDILFPYKRSIENAKSKLEKLEDVVIFKNVGHGIETYAPAINYIAMSIKDSY